ncbi:MAG: formylmethanofuran dehydrogenase subunit E family protein [Deferrisomatales bacterium]|nr:formylmethanofuran dehydrogenase subunit E family protein [Deferrisomatales bacterium]
MCRKPLIHLASAVVVALGLALVAQISLVWAAEPAPEFYDRLEQMHGHTCGGSLMGARLGFAARRALQEAGATGKVKATYYDHSCPVDGIQLAAGTTYGNRAIEVVDRDEHRLVLTPAEGPRVEARITESALDRVKPSRALAKEARKLPQGSPERAELERQVAAIFDWLRTAPESDVVVVRVLD